MNHRRNDQHEEERNMSDVPERKQALVEIELSDFSHLFQVLPDILLRRGLQALSMFRDGRRYHCTGNQSFAQLPTQIHIGPSRPPGDDKGTQSALH